MSVQQIESAITELSKEELARLGDWFAQYKAEQWDRQMEADIKAGKLDALADAADRAFDAGQATRL
jgi:hypothetical protein